MAIDTDTHEAEPTEYDDGIMSEHLRRKVEDTEVEGWQVQSEQGDRVVMVKHDYGSLGGHALIALLTVWWTFGIGNALYAAYRYFGKADKKVIRE